MSLTAVVLRRHHKRHVGLFTVVCARRRRRAPWGLGRGRARRGAGEVLCWKKLLVLLKDRLHYTVPNTLSGNPDTAERDTELSS